MGTTKLNIRTFALTLLACLLVALPAAAKGSNITGTMATFQVKDMTVGYSLKVDGPNGYGGQASFKAGEAIVWNFSDAADDGSYSFELTPVPAQQRVRGVDAPSAVAGDVISGSFRMVGGSFVNPDTSESALTKDVVHLDDVIISFSLCVGNDCVNGESFGFDTIRLKENNVRIHFDDTSTSASFPRNDWRIIVNDSSNGGSNYWAIEDSTAGRQVFRVDAGAPANSLFVDSAGDIGIGTSNPVVDAHIVSGNTPTLRLEQNGSSGFTAQTWDVAGNEANFFIRDATNGSTLPLRIEPGSPSNALYVDSTDGNIGLGTTSPDADLDIEDASPQIKFNRTDTPTATTNDWFLSVVNAGFRITRDSSGDTEVEIDNDGNMTLRGNLTACNDATICTPSDTFPDYVFQPDYPLMPLDKLAAFIEDNKHLPNVPTVEDVSKSGINMTQLQMKLLEKVEELTLYTLSQEQTINDLKQRLQTLEQPE